MSIDANDIMAVTTKVTKKWTKQRKAEERGRSRGTRMYVYSDRVDFTEVAHSILPAGYQHASGGGKYTVGKRQFFYAVREAFLKATGREIEYPYFANTLLVQYMNQRPETAAWKVTADPRGNLTIPNAGQEEKIPCGTLAIDAYLRGAGKPQKPDDLFDEIDPEVQIEWPSLAPGARYQAVLYIEKEGFEPLLKEAKTAERFDLAIVSCKGQSVVAARKLADHVCYVGGGVPLLVAHDFDKAGFEISQRLTTVSERAKETDRVTYRFKNDIDVIDLGLRLEDVEKYELAEEKCDFRGRFAVDSICTPEEQAFLKSGRRVELNAFTSPQFIEWLEAKLVENGLGKRLIPDDETLKFAYRRALVVATINAAIEDVYQTALEEHEDAEIPETLRSQLEAVLESPRSDAWDRVLYDLARAEIA